MAISRDHELNKRRLGRNIGVGGVLLGLVVIVFGLTFVKVSVLDPARNGTARQEATQ